MKVLIILVLLCLPAFVNAQTCAQADLNHPDSAALTWVDNSDNETGFVLERKLNQGAYVVLVAGVGVNVTKYVDSTVVRALVPNTYTYRIKATAPAGYADSPYSNESCITFAPRAPAALPSPGGLTVATISSSAFRITWEDMSGEIGYEVEGKLARGNDTYVQVASLPADSVNYDWTGRKRYTSYCVRVRGLLPVGSPDPATAYTPSICNTTIK
jgi:hypothetical protein